MRPESSTIQLTREIANYDFCEVSMNTRILLRILIAGRNTETSFARARHDPLTNNTCSGDLHVENRVAVN